MRFESVTAHAFGPFVEQAKQFGPGMNVVYGPNESGKSTWHAALYASLCGVRRGRGRPRQEDQHFADQHRPWGSDRWQVSATVQLEDGRRVDLSQDLDGGVACSASDADLAGRDYSDEIINEGSPDGSVWLGLTRTSFQATACVFQRDVLRVRDRSDELQEQLQRAAATAGTDETAAGALARLAEFASEQVGLDRANSTRPLRRSRERAQDAEGLLQAATEAHRGFLDRQSHVQELELTFIDAESRAALHEAALAALAADRDGAKLEEATKLAARFPSGAPSPLAADDELARQIAAALQAWRTRPDPDEPHGSTTDELTEELGQLGTAPDPSVANSELAASGSPRWRRAAGLAIAFAAAASGVGLFVAGAIVPAAILLGGAAGVLVWALTAKARPEIQPPVADAGEERAARRSAVEGLLQARRREETAYTDAIGKRDATDELVRRAAAAAELSTEAVENLAEALGRWEAERTEKMRGSEKAREEWGELQRLLDGRSLDALAEETEERQREAQRLARAFDPDDLAEVLRSEPNGSTLEEMRTAANNARADWEHGRGELEQFAAGVPSVADAEDDLADARLERERVDQLSQTISTTVEFLESAQDQVHRDIAPVLQATVLESLSEITNGRYTGVRVDPETLAVEVSGSGGPWRPADLLSHGTAEQVYLLLRVAMARHLTTDGEVCPLILDDVLAACDSDRRAQVLDLLLTLSASTQVILFGQEEDVLEWAQHRLEEPRDRLIPLDASEVPA